jgi:hypothetical protein
VAQQTAILARQQFTRAQFNVIAGGGYLESHEGIIFNVDGFAFPPFEFTTTHGNAWIYANGSLYENLQVTLGASFDQYRSRDISRHQVNPKLGLSWEIAPGSVLRAAYFESLKRTLVGGQTVEPTEIAGFNQLFDDVAATRAQRWGVGFDQKIAGGLFGGIEWSQRRLTVTEQFVGDQNWQEDFARTYLDWIATDRLSVNFGVQWERYVRNPTGNTIGNFADLDLARLPLEFRYFDPSGMFALLRTSFVDERGHFVDSMGGIFPGHDTFAVVDAGIGWRIPGRAVIGTLQIKNLFNTGFRYQDSDAANPAFIPHRLLVGRVTFSF